MAVDSVDTLGVKNVVERGLSHTVSNITAFCILQRNTRWPQKWRENNFWEKVPDDSVYNLGAKNFAEITLSHTVSKINAFLRFTANFKMAAKNEGKMIFGKY